MGSKTMTIHLCSTRGKLEILESKERLGSKETRWATAAHAQCTCTLQIHVLLPPHSCYIGFIAELLFPIFDSSVVSPPTLICLFVYDRASWVLRAHQASAGNQEHRLALALMVHFSCQVWGRFNTKIS